MIFSHPASCKPMLYTRITAFAEPQEIQVCSRAALLLWLFLTSFSRLAANHPAFARYCALPLRVPPPSLNKKEPAKVHSSFHVRPGSFWAIGLLQTTLDVTSSRATCRSILSAAPELDTSASCLMMRFADATCSLLAIRQEAQRI